MADIASVRALGSSKPVNYDESIFLNKLHVHFISNIPFLHSYFGIRLLKIKKFCCINGLILETLTTQKLDKDQADTVIQNIVYLPRML